MRVIDIDLDFFLDKIIQDRSDSEEKLDERLEEGGILAWNENEVRSFLEFNCGLSKQNRVKGRIIKHHHEAFFFWRDLIKEKKLVSPFDVIHIDAHSDLGGGDVAWSFIFEEVLRKPLEERSNIENFAYRDVKQKLGCGNYLLYALAAHWIRSLTLICHPDWRADYPAVIMKDCKDATDIIQLKKFEGKIKFDIGPINLCSQKFVVDEEIQFNKERHYQLYRESRVSNFDFLDICQSPNFTPASADFILEIIKDYIHQI